MGLEELESLSAGVGLRRSRRVMKKARYDPAMVIDLDDDEIEEEEDWEPRSHAKGQARSVGGSASNPILLLSMFEKNVENTGLEQSNSTRDGLRSTGIGLNAEPQQAMEGEIKCSNDKNYSTRDALRSTGMRDLKAAPPQAMERDTVLSKDENNSVRDSLRSAVINLNAAPQAREKLSNDKKNEISPAMGIDLDDPVVLEAIMDDDIMKLSIDDLNMQQAQVVDLSSSESGDEGGDGDNNDESAEEQEEIVTTLSREDTVTFAEVMKAIKEGADLRKFKMDQLKTYLRHHGLRMVGAKFVLLSRIQEHQRIKDRGEEMYPRSSFSINCKGDVCLGDLVLFLQTVYDMPFDYDRRCASGPPLGKRWVAGKVVSESYGAGKQQHTFTIEVLWSTGVQPLYCMRPVKIKGRNLYRMVTMRQPWSNEADRQMALNEKHARGAAARAIRRAVKGLKSKGKSRADLSVHPYGRPHREESQGIPQETARQNAGIHNRHQGSIPAHIAPTVPLRSSRQPDGTYIYKTFTEDNHPAPPTTPGRSPHTQQSERQCNIKRNLEPTRPAHDCSHPRQHGRSFQNQQNGSQGSSHPARNHPHPRQHGRSFQSQQKGSQGSSYPARNHPHTRQHGRSFLSQQQEWQGNNPPPPRQHESSFHSQQQEWQGNSNPAHNPPPPRAHVQEHGRIHTQRQRNTSNQGHHQQEAIRIPCSNTYCENPGAVRCIMRSCGHCCTRITNMGRCQRHKGKLGNA